MNKGARPKIRTKQEIKERKKDEGGGKKGKKVWVQVGKFCFFKIFRFLWLVDIL